MRTWHGIGVAGRPVAAARVGNGTSAAPVLMDSNMLATGGILVCLALLALTAVAPVFRSSNPPRWTTYDWVGELISLAIVCALALGLGYLGAGATEAFRTGPNYDDLGLLARVLFLSVVI